MNERRTLPTQPEIPDAVEASPVARMQAREVQRLRALDAREDYAIYRAALGAALTGLLACPDPVDVNGQALTDHLAEMAHDYATATVKEHQRRRESEGWLRTLCETMKSG